MDNEVGLESSAHANATAPQSEDRPTLSAYVSTTTDLGAAGNVQQQSSWGRRVKTKSSFKTGPWLKGVLSANRTSNRDEESTVSSQQQVSRRVRISRRAGVAAILTAAVTYALSRMWGEAGPSSDRGQQSVVGRREVPQAPRHPKRVKTIFPQQHLIRDNHFIAAGGQANPYGGQDTLVCMGAKDHSKPPHIPVVFIDKTPFLKLQVKHVSVADPEKNWWSTWIFLNPDETDGQHTHGFDVTGFDRLVIEAFAVTKEPAPHARSKSLARLRVRLEDDQYVPGHDGHKPGPRQSTNWSSEHVDHFLPADSVVCHIYLNRLRWDKYAFRNENQADVNPKSIKQITIGHEGDDPDWEGTIYIKRIALEDDDETPVVESTGG